MRAYFFKVPEIVEQKPGGFATIEVSEKQRYSVSAGLGLGRGLVQTPQLVGTTEEAQSDGNTPDGPVFWGIYGRCGKEGALAEHIADRGSLADAADLLRKLYPGIDLSITYKVTVTRSESRSHQFEVKAEVDEAREIVESMAIDKACDFDFRSRIPSEPVYETTEVEPL